jgi:hypothetical protein
MGEERLPMTRKPRQPDDGTDDDTTPEKESRSIETALQAILDKEPDLSVMRAGIPFISWPLDKASEERTFCKLQHAQIKPGLAAFVWDTFRIVLYERELNRLVRVLEGFAWRNITTDAELSQAIEQDPFLETLFLYLRTLDADQPYEGSCSLLLSRLEKCAAKNRLLSSPADLPGGAPQLSRKLEESREFLEKLGYQLARGRYTKTGDRFVRISLATYSDDDDQTASDHCKSTPAEQNNVLVETDDADGAIADLMDQIRAPKQGT